MGYSTLGIQYQPLNGGNYSVGQKEPTTSSNAFGLRKVPMAGMGGDGGFSVPLTGGYSTPQSSLLGSSLGSFSGGSSFGSASPVRNAYAYPAAREASTVGASVSANGANSTGSWSLPTKTIPGAGGSTGGGAAAQSAYSNWGMPTFSQDYYNDLRGRMSGPTNAQSFYDSFTPTSYMQDYASGRMSGGYGDDKLASRLDDRLGQAVPSYLSSQLPDLKEWVNAQAETSKLQQLVGSDKGDTGSFLKGFDVNKTAGLGDTYDVLAGEGPTYEEDFYTSLINGSNPQFEMLKKDFSRDVRNSAAARGGFVSGRSIDAETRGLSRLTADEFANRGNLAASAGNARRARLGQRLTAAQALDQQLLNRQQLRAQTGLGRENILSGLAQATDATDVNRRTLYANAGNMADTTTRLWEADLDNLTNNAEQSSFARQRALDSLAALAGAEAMQNTVNQGGFAIGADQSNYSREGLLGGAASRASAEQSSAARDKFDAAMRLGGAYAGIGTDAATRGIGALSDSSIAGSDARLGATGIDINRMTSSANARDKLMGQLGGVILSRF